jgi:putative transposase
VAADFFTVEVWTRTGLQRFSVLLFLDLSTRNVEGVGMAATVNGLWMSQIGRKVTDVVEGILLGKRYLIHDRDPLFTAEFLTLLAAAGCNRRNHDCARQISTPRPRDSCGVSRNPARTA